MGLVEFDTLTKYIEPLTKRFIDNEDGEEDSLELDEQDEVPILSSPLQPLPPLAAAKKARTTPARALPPPPAAPRAKGCLDLADPLPLLGSPAAAGPRKVRRLAAGSDVAPARLLLDYAKLEGASLPASLSSSSSDTGAVRGVALAIDQLVARLLAPPSSASSSPLSLTRLV